jgi:outer membrane murein-binding lipoprotein Lpp
MDYLNELVRCEADVKQFGSAVDRLRSDLAAHRAGIKAASQKLDSAEAGLRRCRP